MQVGGIGSGNSGFDNHGVSHRITNGFHEHGTVRKQTGGASLSSSAVPSSMSTGKGTEAAPSLWDNLRNLFGGGRRLLARIWGEDADAAEGESDETGNEELAALKADEDASRAVSEDVLTEGIMLPQTLSEGGSQTGILTDVKRQHESHIVAASANVQAPQNMVAGNPYFTTNSDGGKVKETLLQKIRIRFRDITDQLMKRFGGTLAGTGQFSTKSSLTDNRRPPKQDMRRRSRYKEDDVEIDCVITDDSYLMDSYDRHGKYTQLGSGDR